MTDLIRNYDDEMICPVCNGIGRVLKRNKRVSDLTVEEIKILMVECFEMLKRKELDTSMEEYKKLTVNCKKPSEEVFVKDGKPVSKEY